jgi:hypothetical protein
MLLNGPKYFAHLTMPGNLTKIGFYLLREWRRPPRCGRACFFRCITDRSTDANANIKTIRKCKCKHKDDDQFKPKANHNGINQSIPYQIG